MSKFFVCHEPQCTEVVLNPYRHHLEVHSCDLTDEAIVSLRRQASKRELQILKERKKSTTKAQFDEPKSRKFGESLDGKVSKKKKTLDILSSNVSMANSTGKKEEINSLAGMPLVCRTGCNEKGKSCSNSVHPVRAVHKTFSYPNPTLSYDIISQKNEKNQKKIRTEVSHSSSSDDNLQWKKRKCETASGSVQKVLKNANKRSSKSKLCKITQFESLKKGGSDAGTQTSSGENSNKGLANSSDRRSIASVRSKNRLDSVQKDSLIRKTKQENEIFFIQFQSKDSVCERVPSLPLNIIGTETDSTALVGSTEIKHEPSTSDIVVTDFEGTDLIENSDIKQEFSTSVGYTLQQKAKVELTHDTNSEHLSVNDNDAPVSSPSPNPFKKIMCPQRLQTMERRMSPPRLQSTQTHSFSTYTLDGSGPPPSQEYQSSESSPFNVSPPHSTPIPPLLPVTMPAVCPQMITLSQLPKASRHPVLSSNIFQNPALASTSNRYYWQVMPPPPNSSRLSPNLRGCLSSSSSNTQYQTARPSSSNWNSSTQLLQKIQTSSKICDSPKTLLQGQLHATTKIISSEKSKPKRAMSRWDVVPSKLNTTSLPSLARGKQCFDNSSPNSLSKLLTRQPDDRNSTKITHLQPIDVTNGENSAKSSFNLKFNNPLVLESNGSNQTKSCGQPGKCQETTSPTHCPVHSRTVSVEALPSPNHLNITLSVSNKQLVPVDSVEKDSEPSRSVHDKSQLCNETDSSLNTELHHITAMGNETSHVRSITSMSTILIDETTFSMSRDEIMYRFLVSQYAIGHLSSCIETPTNTLTIGSKDALNIQNVLMMLLFLKSGGDMTLLCLLTVFDVLGAQNMKGNFQVLHQSTGKTLMLSNSEQNYAKNFIKIVRPALSKDSYGFLFTKNSLPFTETLFRQALRYCWGKAQIGCDVSTLWRHVKQTSLKCKSVCNNDGSQNSGISSTSEIEDVEESPGHLSTV